MASTASLHKNKKSTLARIKRFLAKDDHFSTSANQIIMKCYNSLHSQIYSSSIPVQLSVVTLNSSHETQKIIQCAQLNPAATTSMFKSANVGDEYGPTWSTHLFKVTVRLPSNWSDKTVHLRWNSSSEAMLFDHVGNVLQGFIPKHRESFSLTNSWKGDSEITELVFYVEMACNGLFGALGEGFSIDPPIPDLKYKLKMADFSVFEPLIFKLYTDLEVLLGMAEELADDIRGFQALYSANEMINLIISNEHEKARSVASKFFSEENGAKAHTLVAMGHCHIDTAWLWTYAETRRKCARSWASQIELMKTYPDIVFTCSQIQQFEWLKEDYPGLFDQIKEFVKLKRFIPVGGTFVEMDGLLPNGESFIRQFVYGQKFLEKEFGMRAKEFWLPDTFGYSGQIPQIIKHMGISRFLTQKISWNRVNKFPHHSFWWEGIDGSKVLAHFPPGDSYEMNGWVKEVLKSVNNSEDKGRTNIGAYLYGLGDGGGGPTVSIVERLHRIQNVDGLPKIVFAGPDYFFDKLESDSHKLCKWVGELYLEMHNGTYTSQANIKWYNRKIEMLLKSAELKTTCNKLQGKFKVDKQAMQVIEDCWKGLLLNQFHDVIPGSCIEQVVVDALKIYQSVFSQLNTLSIKQSATFGLNPIELQDLTQDQIVVFNPLPWAVKSVLSIPVNGRIQTNAGLQYVELDGFPNCQEHHEKNYPLWTFGNPSRFVACLSEVKPSGYSTVKPDSLGERSKGLVKFSKSDDGSTGIFSNGIIRLEFSLKGSPKERLFKIDENSNASSEWEVFKDYNASETEPGMFYIYDDNPVCWDAWDCDDFHLETRRSIFDCNESQSGCGTIEVVAEGPLVAIYKWKVTAQSKFTGGIPLKITRYTMITAESPLLEYTTIIDWANQSHKFLKVEFPINVFAREAAYEIQYGHIKRPTHSNTSWDMAQIETSGHKWVDISQQDRGVSLLNDSKYGFRIKDNIIQFSLLRAPKAPDGNCDMHQHVIRYAIFPHEGSFQNAATVQKAYEFNSNFEFYGLKNDTADCTLPSHIITTSHNAVIPEVIKLSHKNPDNLICIRLFESFGSSPSNVAISVRFPVTKILECNGMEDEIATNNHFPVSTEEKVISDGQTVTLYSFSANFRPFEIRSFLLFL